MTSSRGDFEGALDVFLSFDFGKIHVAVRVVLKNFPCVHAKRRNFYFTFEKLRGLAQVLDGNHLQAFDDCRFPGVFDRD